METKRWFEKLKYTEVLHAHPYQQCVRCIMDTSDPEIDDTDGVCNATENTMRMLRLSAPRQIEG